MKKCISNCKIIFLLSLVFIGTRLKAQNPVDSNLVNQVNSLSQDVKKMKEGDSHFMIVGLTTFGFFNQNTTNTLGGVKSSAHYNSFGDADRYELSPMFLFRHGDNLLVEFEPSFNGSGLGVNWAAVSYFLSPGLILRGGYFVLPVGSYSKRLAAGWINKLASDPVGSNPAGTDFGVEVEGGFPLGSMKASYDLALSNGFQINPDGTYGSVGISAIQNNKTFSGRIALLPFSNSSLEIGFSGLYGNLAYAGTQSSPYNNPNLGIYALDFTLIKNLNPVQINIKGQYSMAKINRQNYISPIDSTKTYTFDNSTETAYGQASIRPFLLDNPFLKNLEFAYRYTYYSSPSGSNWGQTFRENDWGLDYWLSWRTVLKITYENINAQGTSNVSINGIQGSSLTNRVILQFSTGF